MAYADKCFYFDWGNREIKLQDFDDFESISLRKRLYYGEDDEGIMGLSIELWGKEKENGERYEDKEIVLSKDDAMMLATKITRAVAELDAEEYQESSLRLLYTLEELHYDELEERRERLHRAGIEPEVDKKGGLGGALKNFIDTPMGEDALKKMTEVEGDEVAE